MPVTLTIKNVPDALATRLRNRAARNHRSLQGELMHILESLMAAAPYDLQTKEAPKVQDSAVPARLSNILEDAQTDDLLERLNAIMGDKGLDTTALPSRDELHQRESWKRYGI